MSEPPAISRLSFGAGTGLSGPSADDESSDEDYECDVFPSEAPAVDIAQASRDMRMQIKTAFDLCVSAVNARNIAFDESENFAKNARKLTRIDSTSPDFDIAELNKAMADWQESIVRLRFTSETYNFVRNKHLDLIKKFDELLESVPEPTRVLLRYARD
jgi:hypothetical protein